MRQQKKIRNKIKLRKKRKKLIEKVNDMGQSTEFRTQIAYFVTKLGKKYLNI